MKFDAILSQVLIEIMKVHTTCSSNQSHPALKALRVLAAKFLLLPFGKVKALKFQIVPTRRLRTIIKINLSPCFTMAGTATPLKSLANYPPVEMTEIKIGTQDLKVNI